MAILNAFAANQTTSYSKADNELLTRVGPGTPMGELFRQYWIPVVPSSHLPDPGGKPLPVKLLGEDLLAFRTLNNTVGVVGSYCSHRRAMLLYGRVEADGIRCPYHGWKYGPTGKCIEMPNIPAEHQFKERVRHPGYPTVEHGGVIWTFMGSASELPALPEFEFTMVPEDQREFALFYHECNYLQALEGGIDPTHVMWLHAPYNLQDNEIAEANQPVAHRLANSTGQRTPMGIEIVDTAGGFMYGARRPMKGGRSLWRINQFIVPFYSMPPGGDIKGGRMWVPMDDEQCIKWMFTWYPTREIMEKTTEARDHYIDGRDYAPVTSAPYGHVRPRAAKSNDYLIDWEVTKTRRLGISGINLQDKCAAESQGPTPILDRSTENLCVGDLTIIKARRILREAALALQKSQTIPVGVRSGEIYRVRAATTIVPDNLNWVDAVRELVTVAPKAA